MSTQTPPGWYPDPTATQQGQERWWDGTAWTEHRRAVPAVTVELGTGTPRPGHGAPVTGPPIPGAPIPGPSVPGAPVPGPGAGTGRGSGRAKVVTIAAVGAVLVGAIAVGGILVAHDNDTPSTVTSPTPVSNVPTATTGSPAPSPEPTSSDADPSVVTDELNGITVPLPDGWQKPEYISRHDVLMTTEGHYDCPVEGGVCWRGLVISRTATGRGGTSPEALAKADIADAAEEAYDEDIVEDKPYGGITGHELVKAQQVAVAGRVGYLVRWRVHTAAGPGGYVQSLAFPSGVGTGAPVLMRFVFDAGKDGPPLAVMDAILKSIRIVGDSGPGGGVGSSIGPSR